LTLVSRTTNSCPNFINVDGPKPGNNSPSYPKGPTLSRRVMNKSGSLRTLLRGQDGHSTRRRFGEGASLFFASRPPKAGCPECCPSRGSVQVQSAMCVVGPGEDQPLGSSIGGDSLGRDSSAPTPRRSSSFVPLRHNTHARDTTTDSGTGTSTSDSDRSSSTGSVCGAPGGAQQPVGPGRRIIWSFGIISPAPWRRCDFFSRTPCSTENPSRPAVGPRRRNGRGARLAQTGCYFEIPRTSEIGVVEATRRSQRPRGSTCRCRAATRGRSRSLAAQPYS